MNPIELVQNKESEVIDLTRPPEEKAKIKRARVARQFDQCGFCDHNIYDNEMRTKIGRKIYHNYCLQAELIDSLHRVERAIDKIEKLKTV